MKVLVTGSRGFVGRNLIPYLEARQFEVIGLDKKTGSDLVYCLGSFGSFPDLAQVDTVIHLAAESEGTPQTLLENINGTCELFEACTRNFQITKIILFSVNLSGTENFNLETPSVYEATKGAQELLAQAYIKSFDLPIVIARSVNIFGPNQSANHLIPTLCRQALEGQVGIDEAFKQWVYIDHVCDFLNFLCLASFIPPKSVLHITGTKGIYTTLLARTILNLLGKSSEVVTEKKLLGQEHSLERTNQTDNYGCPSYQELNFMDELKQTVMHYRELYGK